MKTIRLQRLPALILGVVAVAACPGPRVLDGLQCDSSAACLEDFICVDGVCITASVCGDGVRGVGEECDGDDLSGATCAGLIAGALGGVSCDAECRIDSSGCAVRCGDGIRAPGEQCDDGNSADADLCSSFCMLTGPPGLEDEPNNDAVAALGAYSDDALIAGAVAAGDQDFFALTFATATTLTVSVHGREGLGTCGIPAQFALLDNDGVLFTVNNGAATGCPALQVEIGAGRTLFVAVNANDGASSLNYLLALDFTQ